MSDRKAFLRTGLRFAAVVAVLAAGVFLAGCRERKYRMHPRSHLRLPAARSARHHQPPIRTSRQGHREHSSRRTHRRHDD